MINRQIYTTWKDGNRAKLTTSLRENKLPELKVGEILVKNLFVPMHGSFWLASHPDGLHPRIDEFMAGGGFVFGNGGIAQVVKTNEDPKMVREGDYVTVWGHVPCDNYDCYGCSVLHRYTECEYNQSGIIGHGKGSYDGTYADYTVLPRFSYDVCFRAEENPDENDLLPFMFTFLLADVRNALTRHPDAIRMPRLLIFGAGYSGMIAAYLFNNSSSTSKIFSIDVNSNRLDLIKDIAPSSIMTLLLDNDLAEQLNSTEQRIGFRGELRSAIKDIAVRLDDYFEGKGVNLLIDCSSGNTAPLWDNRDILGPTTIVIPFGFGSEYILLNKELIQCSGLNILMSRGVGNIRNRRETLNLVKRGGGDFIRKFMVDNSRQIVGLENVTDFIREMQSPPKSLSEIDHVYMDLR